MKKKLKWIMIIVVIYLIFSLARWLNIFNFKSNSIKELSEVETIERMDYNKFKIYDDRLILYNDTDGVIYLKNDEILPITAGIADKEIIFGENNIYVIDKVVNIVKILDLDGAEVNTLFLAKTLFKLKEENNKLLMHYKDPEGESIEIMNLEGVVENENKVDRGNILTIDLNEKASNYIISVLDTTKGDIVSTVSYYNMKNDKLWSLDIKNEIVMRVHTVGSENIICTDENIHLVNNRKIVWSKKIDDIDSLEVYNSKIYLLYNKTIEIVNLEGKTEYKLGLERDYEDMIYTNDTLILFGDRNILGIKNGEKILEQINDNKIVDMEYNKDNIIIVNIDNIKYYQLKNKKIK